VQLAGVILVGGTCGGLGSALIDNPSLLVVAVLGLGAVSLAGTTLLLAPILRGLQSFPGAPVMQEQWQIMSERLTYARLWLRFFGYLGLATVGVLLSALDTRLLPIGVIDVLIFGTCSLCFAYMLAVKRRVGRP
jgi:hypothetical protein